MKRTWYSPEVYTYVFVVCFHVLLMDTWNIELPVNLFKLRSVPKHVFVMIHRWEFNTSIRDDLPRKTDLLLMCLANALGDTSVGLTWGRSSRPWNQNSCGTKQWWGDLWNSAVPPHTWKTEELYADINSFLPYFYILRPVNREVD